jgi:hypothetical protein
MRLRRRRDHGRWRGTWVEHEGVNFEGFEYAESLMTFVDDSLRSCLRNESTLWVEPRRLLQCRSCLPWRGRESISRFIQRLQTRAAPNPTQVHLRISIIFPLFFSSLNCLDVLHWIRWSTEVLIITCMADFY